MTRSRDSRRSSGIVEQRILLISMRARVSLHSCCLFTNHNSFSLMASSSSLRFFTIFFLLFITFRSSFGCFGSIVSFGDSLTDTGNYLISNAEPGNVGRLPYGETYFHHPTGRFSDGRLILDFIAEAMGLPHVPPFLGGESGRDFPYGVNFAVAGATAIESSFFWKKGIKLSTNYSLDVQIEWFKQFLPSLCAYSSTDCSDVFDKSLFFVGEFGGNDYNVPLFQGRNLDEIGTYIPRVIDAIASAIDDLIDLGAKTLVVPSYLPVGCISGFLTIYQSSGKEEYDPQTGCLKRLNEFAEYHNRKLLQMLAGIRKRRPSATIIYADYYNATMRIYRNPYSFGFGVGQHLSACCGGGGPYNYNKTAECGTEKAKACIDPSRFVCWDGMHLTEAAYGAIANQLVDGPFAIPAISDACYVESVRSN